MNVTFSTSQSQKADALILAVMDGGKLGASGDRFDKKAGGLIKRALKTDAFKGQKGKILTLMTPSGMPGQHIVLLGLGKPKDLDDQAAESLGSALVGKLNALRVKNAVVFLDKMTGVNSADFAAGLANGAHLGSYRFDKYQTRKTKDEKPSLTKLTVVTAAANAAKKVFHDRQKVNEGVFLARDLVSEPPNVLYPKSYADRIRREMRGLGVTVQVLGEAEMRKLKMNALVGVGQGSKNESRLVVMKYNGGGKSAKNKNPLCFVGKGVTFDTGGISLKPGKGMEDMKFDMGGSAAVVGLMKALAGRKARVNAIGVVGLVENMPDGNAQRPGDIVKSMSGQTIEITNTDAEGRLVLCDALWYTQTKFKPRLIIDLATLTGAMIVALGNEYAGCFSNDEKLPKQLSKAGQAVNENVWHMPLCDAYDKAMNSDVADMLNADYGGAGSATAASFLQRFIKKGTPWAHLDIAGTAWTKKDRPCVPKGATGYGVRLLDRFVKDNFEK